MDMSKESSMIRERNPMRTTLTLAALLTLTACAPSQKPAAPQPDPAQFTSILTNLKREPATFSDCSDCPEMVRIPAGSVLMGSPATEPGRTADEGPQHKVTIAKPFALGEYEITNAQYRQFVEATGHGDNDWKMYYTAHTVDSPDPVADTDAYPVVWVSWQDTRDYAVWLSQRTGKHYRLPSEAEWEYAARAGDSSALGETLAARTLRAGATPASFGESYPVGSFGANPFGVHELTTNMPEWVEDCYVNSYDQAPADGSAVEGTCKQRVVRGTYNEADDTFRRIANRDWGYAVNRSEGHPTTIRLARDLE
jgi:formylglycine-generating enzyme required for sulfatase activity